MHCIEASFSSLGAVLGSNHEYIQFVTLQCCWYSWLGTHSILSAHSPSNGHQIASTPLPQTVLKWITHLSPWALSSVETDKRSDETSRQGFTGTCAAAQGDENKKQVHLLTLQGVWPGFLHGVSECRGRWVDWTGLEAQVVCPLPWWCPVQESCVASCFRSWHLRSGSWILVFLYLVVIICPNCSCM